MKLSTSKFTTLAAVLLLTAPFNASADPKEVEKIRRYYKQHGFDFFGDLIADQRDLLEDEKKHAKLELLADDARSKALAQLEKLLKDTSASAPMMRAELLMRKAALFADRARTASYFQNNPFKTSKLQAPAFYLKESNKYYAQVESGYPNHPRMDVIIFSIAYNAGELKEVDKAFTYYQKLVAKFADSPLVGDARLAMAEILFDKRKFGESLSQLKEIVKSDHPRLKNFALYKMAWTYYNMSDLDSGIISLEKVIDGVNALGAQAARIELRKEALHDLVLFYSEARPAVEARAYFEKVAHTPSVIAEEYAAVRKRRLTDLLRKSVVVPNEETDAYQVIEAHDLLFRLTNTYREQGKHESAMTVAEQLIGALPDHPRTPALYRLRAESAEKMRKRALVLTELERLGRIVQDHLVVSSNTKDKIAPHEFADMDEYFKSHYFEKKDHIEPAKNRLTELPKSPLEKQEQTREALFREQLTKVSLDAFKDFTNFFHGEYLKTNSPEIGAQALQAYDIAIRSTPESNFDLRAKRGQLEFSLRKYDEAAQDFEWLAARVIGPTQLEYLKSEIAALEAIGIKAQAQRVLRAYDRVLATQLGAENENKSNLDLVQTILATSARLKKDISALDPALHRMVFYSLRFFQGKDAVALTRDALAIYEQKTRWQELRDYSERLIDKDTYKGSVADKEIRHSNEYATLRLLEQLETDKNWSRATKEFAQFAERNPNSPFYSQALIKSANAAIELKDVKLSIERLESATKASDAKIRLQAWIALEPYYRRAYLYEKLKTAYDSILALKPDATTKQNTEKNLAAIKELSDETFLAAGAKLIAPDTEIAAFLTAIARPEKKLDEFKQLRFKKSNNNPNQNFKKKADGNAELVKLIEKTTEGAPKSLRGSAFIWSNLMKSEALIEFADTLDEAALPAILKQASEVDRKSYIDTIASQAKELRQNAKALLIDAADLIVKADSPYLFEARLNRLLDLVKDPRRFERRDFAKIWKDRPTLEAGAKKDFGIEVLLNEKESEQWQELLKTARNYFAHGKRGYAYAVASMVAAQAKGEIAQQAKVLLFTLDCARLPQRLFADLTTPAHRWDLARWITANKELNREWAQTAIEALLRPAPAERR